MENVSSSFDPTESLQTIRETIELAKKNVQENGFHFLLWGVLVILASLGEWYLRNILGNPKPEITWMIMVLIGVPAAVIYEFRKKRGEKSTSVLSKWYGKIWMAFGISMFLSLFYLIKMGVSPVPVVLVLAGFATFVSGTILRFKPLVSGAIALWLGALICCYMPVEHHTLVEAVAIGFGYLIPGFLLQKNASKS